MSVKCFPLSECIHSGDFPVKVLFHKQKTSSLHYHDYNELVFVLSGHGSHIYNGIEYKISRGDVFVVKPGSHHRYEASLELLIVNVIIDFSSPELSLNDLQQVSGFYALFEVEPLVRKRSKDSLKLRLDPDELDTAYKYLQQIDIECKLKKPGYRFAALTNFYNLLLLISRLYEQPKEKPSENMLKLSTMLHFIEKYYMNDISRDDIVNAAKISSSSGSRIFKKMIGKSIIDYLTLVRIEHAKEKLLENYKIHEVAFMCGFRDSNYFSSVFKKMTGQSPKCYKG